MRLSVTSESGVRPHPPPPLPHHTATFLPREGISSRVDDRISASALLRHSVPRKSDGGGKSLQKRVKTRYPLLKTTAPRDNLIFGPIPTLWRGSNPFRGTTRRYCIRWAGVLGWNNSPLSRTTGLLVCQEKGVDYCKAILSDAMYLFISSRKPTPPQNSQIHISISTSKQYIDDFVGELTFQN